MSALTDHIQKQQDAVSHLCAVLDALQSLHNAKLKGQTQNDLIGTACAMARLINNNLDIVNLPEETSHEAA